MLIRAEDPLLLQEGAVVLGFGQPRELHQHLVNGEVQPRKLTEQELRLRHKKEEAWELFQRQPTLMRKIREKFEKKYGEKVLGDIHSNSKDEQEKGLQSWTHELEKAGSPNKSISATSLQWNLMTVQDSTANYGCFSCIFPWVRDSAWKVGSLLYEKWWQGTWDGARQEGLEVRDTCRRPAGYSRSGLRRECAMTQDNNLLGEFDFNGIPRGV